MANVWHRCPGMWFIETAIRTAARIDMRPVFSTIHSAWLRSIQFRYLESSVFYFRHRVEISAIETFRKNKLFMLLTKSKYWKELYVIIKNLCNVNMSNVIRQPFLWKILNYFFLSINDFLELVKIHDVYFFGIYCIIVFVNIVLNVSITWLKKWDQYYRLTSFSFSLFPQNLDIN